MPAFQILSFKELENNLVKLFEAVLKKHEDNKKEITGVREAQMEYLSDLFSRLKKVSAQPDNAKLYVEHYKKIGSYIRELRELNAIQELTPEQVALRDKLLQEKNALVNMYSNNSTDVNNNEPVEEIQYLNDAAPLIAIGALLTIGKQIELEYAGKTNAVINMFVKNKPENSALFAGIPKAIGVTADNVLDKETEALALAAYQRYIVSMEQIRQFDRSKLKKTNTVVKDQIHFYADKVTNPNILLTDLPKEERDRYTRDDNSVASYLTMVTEVNDEITQTHHWKWFLRKVHANELNYRVAQFSNTRNATPQESEIYHNPVKVKENWKGVAEVSDKELEVIGHHIVIEENAPYTLKGTPELIASEKYKGNQVLEKNGGEQTENWTDHTEKRYDAVSFFRANVAAKIQAFNKDQAKKKALKHVETNAKKDDVQAVKFKR